MKKVRVTRPKRPVVQVRASSGSVLETGLSASGAVVTRIVAVQTPAKEVRVLVKGKAAEPDVFTFVRGGTSSI